MKRTHNIRGFLTGFLAAVLIFALASPAGAALAGKTIQVLTGVDIYVDGVEMKPTDANGKPVDTFVYNGTTYVPLRAVSQYLGKNVNYDGKNQRVYIGEAPGMKQYLLTVCPPYQTEYYTADATYTMAGNKYANGFSLGLGIYNGTALFNLNGQYDTLKFDIGHVDGNSTSGGTLDIYLDGRVAFSVDLNAEMMVEHYEIPLNGALQMKITAEGGGFNTTYNYAMVNVEVE